MELRLLRVFVEVVRQGGFSRAAEVLASTQSTVSKAVKQLEEGAGVLLLDRVGHRTILTSAGEIVFRRGLKLLADREDLLSELSDLRGLKRGTLRLGLPPIGSNVLFAPVFAAYRQRYPHIALQLTEHGSDRLEQALRSGEIDLAGLLLPVSTDFDFEPVQHEPIVALVQRRHRLAARRSLRIGDLRDVPFILFESSFSLHRMVQDACRRAKFEPDVVAVSSQIDFVVELAAAGLGIAFLPATIASQRAHAALVNIPIDDPQMEWHMAMAWRRSGYLSEAAVAWLDLTRELTLHRENAG